MPQEAERSHDPDKDKSKGPVRKRGIFQEEIDANHDPDHCYNHCRCHELRRGRSGHRLLCHTTRTVRGFSNLMSLCAGQPLAWNRFMGRFE
jgi:hypothetical protein